MRLITCKVCGGWGYIGSHRIEADPTEHISCTTCNGKGKIPTKVNDDELAPYSTWRHIKTGYYYTVLGIGICSTNGPEEHKEESVIYISHTHQHLCYREISEFLDGRFKRVKL